MNSAYQLLVIILPIITAPYISRVLGTEGVGKNAFTGSVIQYFILAGSIGIVIYGNREIAYHQKNKEERSQIFWEITFLRFFTVTLSLMAFALFLQFQKSDFIVYLLQGIAILASAFDISWYFMGMEDFKRTVVRNFVVSIASILCTFAFVHKASDLPIYIVIVTGSGLLGNCSLWSYLKKEINLPQMKKLNIKRHIKPTLLLFLPQIATQIYLVVNKTMIGLFDSEVAAGFFSQSDSIIKISLGLATSLGAVMLPHISSLYAEGDKEGIQRLVTKSFNVMAAIAVPLMFGIMAVALKFAPFFYGKDFKIVGILMMMEAVIILFIAWSNVLGTQYLLPANRMKEFTTSVTVGAVLNVLLNLVLLPTNGVIGAMVATVLAELAVTLYQFYLVRKEFDITKMITGTWKYFISGLLMFSVVFYLNHIWKMDILHLILQVMIGGVIYLIANIILKTAIVMEAKKIIFKK